MPPTVSKYEVSESFEYCWKFYIHFHKEEPARVCRVLIYDIFKNRTFGSISILSFF